MEALLGALVVVGQRALVGMGGGLLFGEDIGWGLEFWVPS